MNPIYKFTIWEKNNLFATYLPGNKTDTAINTGSGDEYANPGYSVTDFLAVSPGGMVNVTTMINYVFYDAAKKYISGAHVYPFAGWIQTPDKARYVRLTTFSGAQFTSLVVTNGHLMKPTYKDDLTKDWELESNQRFYRQRLGGKISFIRDDYDYLDGKPFDTEFILLIYKSDDLGVTWESDLQSKFMKTDCTWNADDKKVQVQPDTLDQYNAVIAGLEKEYNLISLAPVIQPLQFKKRPLIQMYIPGDNVVSCFLSGMYWEQDANEVSDRNALVNTYYFALCNLLKEVNVTGSTNPNVNALYSGRMSIGANNTFSGNLYPNVSNGYYIRASQVYQPPFWGVITYEFVRSSDSVVVYRYSYVSPGNRPEDNLDFDAPAVAGSGATGSAHCEMATYSIYARYLCDVDKINDVSTYPLPSEDIVENNRNYRRVIGYAIDVAYISNNSQSEPTQWGIRDDGTYFLPPFSIFGQAYFPIARSTWRYASIWFAFSSFDWILEQAARKTYLLRDANPLSSVISVVLKQFAPDITHEATPEYSQFLYGTNNPISYRQFTLMLSQKSNVLHGDYDRPAQKAPVTLQQLTNMLRDCFRAFWYIEDNKFKIEHISWFRNGGTYNGQIVTIDLTQATNIRNGLKWSFNTAAWDFDKVDLAERYQFAWMDDVTKGFEGFPIEVKSKYVTEGKIENVNVSNFTPDVDYMILNPGALSEDGFALFAAAWNTIVSRNILNGYPDRLTNGYYVSYINGQLLPVAGYSASEFIEVVGNQKYRFTKSQQFAWYDANQTYIGGYDNTSLNDLELAAPANASFLRCTVPNNYISQFDVKGFALPFVDTSINGVEYSLQNGLLSWIYLQPTFYIYDLPARSVTINGSEAYAYGIERKKKQTVNFPSIDDPNPMQLIKTSIGTGQIEKISINLCSRMNKITVKHDTE